MFLAANPDKGRSVEEKAAEGLKYTPGEEVCPKIEEKEKSLRERRREDEDRRLMNEVRDLSLREVGVAEPTTSSTRRRRGESEARTRTTSSREASRDGRGTDERERAERRRRREVERLRREAENTLQPETESSDERRRRRSNDRRRRHEETSRSAARQIEHQSSLRSLISSSDVDSHEMEEEILRQIREEGLLDGIDLENIDVSQEDQISERIAEAFRRRQSERARQEPARRSDTSSRRREVLVSTESRAASDTEGGVRTSRRARTHSRSPSAISNSEQTSRPPVSISAVQSAHLEVQSGDEGRHRRRRTTSNSRSSTSPVAVADPLARPAARSQTDLSNRPSSAQSSARLSISNGHRSNTEPSVQQTVEVPISGERSGNSANSSPSLRSGARFEGPATTARTTPNSSPRLRNTGRFDGTPVATTVAERRLRGAPADIVVSPTTMAPTPTLDPVMVPAPLSPRNPPSVDRKTSLSDRATAISSGSRPNSSSSVGSTVGSRKPTQLYPEPSVTCSRCAKPHIEYELHYNCGTCYNGTFNLCLSCYREGRGCFHWFGFGQEAWAKWEALRHSGHEVERPHMLTASRYIPPRSSPGGADGRRTLTGEDPQKRLQSGTFCMSCFAWSNECYWRCDFCNGGDWGFCDVCVNQGKCCTHALLPLTYSPPEMDGPPLSPTHDHQAPLAASILTGPGVMSFGNFKPLTFSTRCDVCRYVIKPSDPRYHCFTCTSKMPNTLAGNYDVCTSCYLKQVASRRISAENGNLGWRRCLKGHRMVVVAFEDTRGGQRRIILQDLVGGRGLHEEACSIQDHSGGGLQKWSWGDGMHTQGDDTHAKLVTVDVMKTAPLSVPGMTLDGPFPPDGGVGMDTLADWSWYPAVGADDELLFPKGAEVREVKDVNEAWWHGTYMGRRGIFPAPYVKVLERRG